MSAFGFRFKKKPIDFSKLRDLFRFKKRDGSAPPKGEEHKPPNARGEKPADTPSGMLPPPETLEPTKMPEFTEPADELLDFPKDPEAKEPEEDKATGKEGPSEPPGGVEIPDSAEAPPADPGGVEIPEPPQPEEEQKPAESMVKDEGPAPYIPLGAPPYEGERKPEGEGNSAKAVSGPPKPPEPPMPPEPPKGPGGPKDDNAPEKKPEKKKRKEKLFFRKGAGLQKFISPRKLILAIAVILIGVSALKFAPKYVPKVKEKFLPGKKPKQEELISKKEMEVEELVTVRTYRVARGDFVDILPGMGTVKGDREVELRFAVNGVVDSINFFEGDLIRKGDIVATLDQKDALLKLEYAKSKLKTQEVAELSAKKKLDIHQQLYDKGIIIKAKLEEVRLEYEGAKTQVKSAQKEVEFALAELDKTYLYSPVDAVMGTRDVEVGEFINSNVKIASLYDVTSVIAEIGIIEKDINRVALGQKAKISVDTYPGVEFIGKIDNIAPIIEGKSRTLTVKVRIKNDNPKGTLLPGMFARIWISVYEKKNTIKIPAACLYDLNNDGEFDSVYAVDENNIAKVRPVKIGYVSTDFIEVVDGLHEGEQVVSESMAELKDNVKVDVIEVQEAMF